MLQQLDGIIIIFFPFYKHKHKQINSNISYSIMKSTLLILSVLLIVKQASALNPQCLAFTNSQCILCPLNSHLYQNQCYPNITACINYQYYSGVAKCVKCNNTISTLVSSLCVLNSNIANSSSIQNVTTNSLSKGSISSSIVTNATSTNSGNAYYYNVDQYGQGNFQYVCLCQAVNDNLFNLCNKKMITGEYSHFISKTSQPVISVSTNLSGQVRQFKILYEGSGENLLLAIISININTLLISLLSFVSIGTTQIVHNCIDYSLQIQCMRCSEGYHLQQRNGDYNCYQNIDGCTSYFRDICLSCSGFLLLVENRCVSTCSSISDCRSIVFYHNSINLNVSNSSILILSRLPF